MSKTMSEFNIENIWEENQQEADAHFNTIEPKLLEMAKQDSNSVIAKLKKKIYLEIVLTFLMLVVVLIPFYDALTPLLIAALIGINLAVLMPYRKFLKDLQLIPTLNIVESLEGYIKLMNNFITRLKVVTLVLTPLLLLVLVKIFLNAQGKPIDFEQLGTGKIIGLIVTGIISYLWGIWVTIKWYIPSLYGTTKEEFEALLVSLRKEE